jgi:hypothetical protein
MKKLIILTFAIGFVLTGFGQSTLPNGTFEDWYFAVHPTHAGGGFYEPSGGFFKSLNILDTIPTPPGLTCYPTDSAFSGDTAVRLITEKINLLNVLIPGVVGTCKISWLTFNAILGTPYYWTTKPANFQGYYMSFPANNDSAGAILLLSKWNSATHHRDTIAYNRMVFHGTVSSYTLFDEPVNYWDNTTMPDSITLLLLSSAGFNVSNMMLCTGQVGSQAYFDDVTLTNINGIPTVLMPDVGVTVHPVPAVDFMTVTFSKSVKNGIFEVYNVQGKLLGRYPVNELSIRIPVGDLAPGMYYYKVTDGTSALNTGSFMVAR